MKKNIEKDGRLARGEARKLLLLDAAVGVIAQQGAGNLTHRAVAGEAHVSLASVTYHFPTIELLRCEVFDHAGSRIGLAFRALIEQDDVQLESIPEIFAGFAVSLIKERREDTVAVYEMIMAAVHNPELRPVIGFLNDRLADLLELYVGSRTQTLILNAAIQGVILNALVQDSSEEHLHASIIDLISRFRALNE